MKNEKTDATTTPETGIEHVEKEKGDFPLPKKVMIELEKLRKIASAS